MNIADADPLVLSILLVEDDAADQSFMRRALTRTGLAHRLTVVNDGEEAMDYLQAQGVYADRLSHPLPQLIISDLKMPRMDGFGFLSWISGREAFRLIPIVVLTSSSDEEDMAKAYGHGARAYLIKPVRFGDLVAVVRTLADYWQVGRVPDGARG